MFHPHRTLGIAVLLLALASLTTRAAFPVPQELEKASDEDTLRYLQLEGDRSLHEKLEVGRQRYIERLAFRKSLTDAMRTNREERKTAIASQLAAAPVVAKSTTPEHQGLLWVAALAILGVCVFLHFHIRRTHR